MIPSFLCGLFLFLLQLKIDNSGDADAFDAIHVCNIDVVNGDEAFDTGNLTEFKFKLAHGFYLIHLGFWPHDLDKAKLWLDSGKIFGPETAQFERFNMAAPRAVIEEAFGRLKKALEN